MSKDLALKVSDTQGAWIEDSTADINIASGSVRSGKTFGQIWKLFLFLQSVDCIEQVSLLFVGKTGGTLDKNIIEDFLNLMEKLGRLDDFNYIKAPDRKIYYKPKKLHIHFVGGNDEGSESKIRGMTIQALFGDELTLLPQSFINQCFARMSAGIKRAWFTTNPDSPAHWFYSEYIMNPDLDIKMFYFTLTDNPSLDAKYKKQVSSIYKVSDYDRFILGKWVADKDSMVFPEFLEKEDKLVFALDRPKYCNKLVGMDVGFRDLTFLVFGYYDFNKAIAVIEGEIVMRAPLTTELAKLIREKEKELWGVEYLGDYEYKDDVKPWMRFSDTDLMLINDLSVTHQINFAPTAKDHKDAQINKVRRMFDEERIIINPECKRLIAQLRTGTWAKGKLTYSRSDSEGHFDGLDALLYFIRNLPEHSNPNPAGSYNQDRLYVSQGLLDRTDDSNLNTLKEAFGL